MVGPGSGDQLVHIGIGKLGFDGRDWAQPPERIGNHVHRGDLRRIHFDKITAALAW